jgi:hypothetical protein
MSINYLHAHALKLLSSMVSSQIIFLLWEVSKSYMPSKLEFFEFVASNYLPFSENGKHKMKLAIFYQYTYQTNPNRKWNSNLNYLNVKICQVLSWCIISVNSLKNKSAVVQLWIQVVSVYPVCQSEASPHLMSAMHQDWALNQEVQQLQTTSADA